MMLNRHCNPREIIHFAWADDSTCSHIYTYVYVHMHTFIHAYIYILCPFIYIYIYTNRSEGLTPNGIFGPWAWWSRGLARWESCWDIAAAVAVTWKFRSETVLVFGPESVSYERPPRFCVKFRRVSFLEKSFLKFIKIIFPRFPGYPQIPGNMFQK